PTARPSPPGAAALLRVRAPCRAWPLVATLSRRSSVHPAAAKGAVGPAPPEEAPAARAQVEGPEAGSLLAGPWAAGSASRGPRNAAAPPARPRLALESQRSCWARFRQAAAARRALDFRRAAAALRLVPDGWRRHWPMPP